MRHLVEVFAASEASVSKLDGGRAEQKPPAEVENTVHDNGCQPLIRMKTSNAYDGSHDCQHEMIMAIANLLVIASSTLPLRKA